ncbi:hypothetical protein ABW21_db0200608 [Orbilia brochopaga]|nr:hypothetical protein ABW21_db0200608 [Drechslerella brochopaga]
MVNGFPYRKSSSGQYRRQARRPNPLGGGARRIGIQRRLQAQRLWSGAPQTLSVAVTTPDGSTAPDSPETATSNTGLMHSPNLSHPRPNRPPNVIRSVLMDPNPQAQGDGNNDLASVFGRLQMEESPVTPAPPTLSFPRVIFRAPSSRTSQLLAVIRALQNPDATTASVANQLRSSVHSALRSPHLIIEANADQVMGFLDQQLAMSESRHYTSPAGSEDEQMQNRITPADDDEDADISDDSTGDGNGNEMQE